MVTLVKVHRATIFNSGKRLDVEVEYYKTIVKVYLLDKSKYFPLVWDFKFTKEQFNKMNMLDIRKMAIDLKLL